MTRHRLLDGDRIVVPLAARTLGEALGILLDRLEAAGAIRDSDTLRDAFAQNDGRPVITIGRNVALPHFRTDAVADLVVALGIAPRPIPVGDTEARILALVLAPPDATSIYLRAVSALARTFRQEGLTDRLLACTSSEDVMAMAELGSLEIQPRVTVGDIMLRDVPAARPDSPVREVVERMTQKGARGVPVVGEKGEVLGMVSESDVLRGMLLASPRERDEDRSSLLPPLTARDIMSRSVMCIAETIGLEEAAQLMVNKDVEQFPVVREGRFTGVVTRADILKKLYGR